MRWLKWSQFRSNVASGAVSMAASLLIAMVMARYVLAGLGTELYGLWSVLSFVMVIGNIGDQGLGDSIVRHVALSHARNESYGVQGYFLTGFVIAGGIGLSVLGGIIPCRWAILGALGVPQHLSALAAVVLVGLGGLLVFYLDALVVSSALNGLGRIDVSNYSTLLGRVVQLLVTLVSLRLGLGIWSLLSGQLFYQAIWMIVGVVVLRRIISVRLWAWQSVSREKARDITKMGGKLVVARVIGQFVDPLMRVTLGRYAGLHTVTFFDIAMKAIGMATSVPIAGIKAIIQRISAADAKGPEGTSDIQRVNKNSTWLLLAAALPLFLVLYGFGGQLLRLWLGPSYDPKMQSYLRLLLVPYYFHLGTVPRSYSLVGLGRTGLYALAFVVTFVTFLIVLLANRVARFPYGAEGLIVGYGVAIASGACSILFVYRSAIRSRLLPTASGARSEPA